MNFGVENGGLSSSDYKHGTHKQLCLGKIPWALSVYGGIEKSRNGNRYGVGNNVRTDGGITFGLFDGDIYPHSTASPIFTHTCFHFNYCGHRTINRDDYPQNEPCALSLAWDLPTADYDQLRCIRSGIVKRKSCQ